MQIKKLTMGVLLVSFLSLSVHAAVNENKPKTTRAKAGLGLKYMTTNQYQVGFQGSQFIEDSMFHIGAEIDFQNTFTNPSGTLVSAALLVGLEKAAKPTIVGGSLAVGAGFFSNIPGVPSYSVSPLLMPEVYGGLVLGDGFRLVLTAGYAGFLSQSAYSGGTFGIRIERKTETTVVGIDD